MNSDEKSQLPGGAPPPSMRELLGLIEHGTWPVIPYTSADKWIEIPQPGIRIDFDDVDHDNQRAIAAFVSRMNPETVKAVLDALEAAKERAGQHRMTHYYATGGTIADPDEALQAKLFDVIALLNGSPSQ